METPPLFQVWSGLVAGFPINRKAGFAPGLSDTFNTENNLKSLPDATHLHREHVNNLTDLTSPASHQFWGQNPAAPFSQAK